jgi:FlgD Ig-like domain
VTRRAQLVMGALFVATLCAIVATQRLKDAPALLRRVHVTPVFTPNGDGWRDRVAVRFLVGRSDEVSVAVLDRHGRVVRRLADRRPLSKGRFLRVYWDGRTAAGGPAPPGTYRVRVRLDRRGRTIVLTQHARLSDRPAHGRRSR